MSKWLIKMFKKLKNDLHLYSSDYEIVLMKFLFNEIMNDNFLARFSNMSYMYDSTHVC